MWLGEQITERGVGNGISMIIFAGIVAGLPNLIMQSLSSVDSGQTSLIGPVILACYHLGCWRQLYLSKRPNAAYQ